jgi:DNA polymerase-1
MKHKKLVVVDGHAMIHRAFHAVPEDLSTSAGEPVNATFGFTSMLIRALAEEKPDYVAMTFDRPTPTFRHEQFSAYKAQRPTLPDNMRPQFGRIREMVQAFGIPIYEKDGYEADDVIGTLSVQARRQGLETIIYTGDMDTLQLVNEHVIVKVAKRGISEVTEYDEAAVQQRYGLPPGKLPDYKGLVGDKSDNIPGVPGIGEKTAARLLNEYGDLEGVLAHVNELKPKEQKLLALPGMAEQARQSKHLATIVLNVPVQLDLAASRLTHIDSNKVLALFRELGFNSMVERVRALFTQLGVAGQETAASERDTAVVEGEAAVDRHDTAASELEAVASGHDMMASLDTIPEIGKDGETALSPPPAAPTGATARGKAAASATLSSAFAQDAELLYAPPVGMVPILTPPLPPATGLTRPLDLVAAVPASASVATVEQVGGATEAQEATQLSLFEVAEAQPAAVRHLHLPSAQRTPGAPVTTPGLSSSLIMKESATNTLLVDSEEIMRALVHGIRAAGGVALDTETTSEDPRHAELVGISLAMAPGEAYYIPVGHVQTIDGQDPGRQLPLAYVVEALRPVLEDEKIKKYMHNAKYDMMVLGRAGITVRGLAFDTMVGAYVAEPGRRGLGLKEQAFQRLGLVMTPISDLIGRGGKMISMAQVPIRVAANYAGADADATLRLVEPIMAELRQHSLLHLYNSIELPLIPVLMQMEAYGVALDTNFLREFEARLAEQLAAIERAIYDAVGHEFNINSTRQLGDILFGELKLPSGKKTKTGYSVSADVIEGLRGQHPMIDYLLEYRQLSKLKSTYVDGLLALTDSTTGRVYTSFNQTIASSGRLSSSNPNLQNIPIRTELGRQIRRAFIADPSYVLLTADYSQFELRILASITHELRLVEAFSKDEDIHTITAASLFNVPAEQVTKDQRRLAKTVVYAVLYGQSAFGLSQVTGMSNKEAAEFISRYHETFPNIKHYVERTLEQARKQGYVNTLFGRKRFIPDMRALSHNERQALEREAINMPIQGSNADLIKMAMLHLFQSLREQRMKTRMILQVHDELVFEVPVEELERARRLIKREMEQVYPKLGVPIKVEMKVGRNWYEAEPME